ncbi:hypothetical protein M2G53_22105 [Vibrio vulnificus]|nr:hypothetical protein [Vibrio vulnificus]
MECGSFGIACLTP